MITEVKPNTFYCTCYIGDGVEAEAIFKGKKRQAQMLKTTDILTMQAEQRN